MNFDKESKSDFLWVGRGGVRWNQNSTPDCQIVAALYYTWFDSLAYRFSFSAPPLPPAQL